MIASTEGGPPPPVQPAGGRPRAPRRPRGPQQPLAHPDELDAIIVAGNLERLVRKAEVIGRRLREPLKTAHLRSIYAELQLIETSWPPGATDEAAAAAAQRALLLLKPKIAYQAAKHRAGVGPLRTVLELAIDRIQGDRARFQRFVDFVGAILAYHRAAGGEEKDVL